MTALIVLFLYAHDDASLPLASPKRTQAAVPEQIASAPTEAERSTAARDPAWQLGVFGSGMADAAGVVGYGGAGGLEVGYRPPLFGGVFRRALGLTLLGRAGGASLPAGPQIGTFFLHVPLRLSGRVLLGERHQLDLGAGPSIDFANVTYRTPTSAGRVESTGLGAEVGIGYGLLLGIGMLSLHLTYHVSYLALQATDTRAHMLLLGIGYAVLL